MRTILIGLGVLLVIGVAALLVIGPQQSGEAQSVTANARTATITRTTLYSSVESTGSVDPAQTRQLSFGAAGTVTELRVDEGDTVTAGQVLALLDTEDLEYQVEQAEQSLAVQQASYDKTVATPTARELAQAEASLLQAQNQLESAQIDVENEDDQLATACTSADSALETLEAAQAAYDDYVAAGYELDAAFVPDPDSQQAEALHDAQTAYDNAQTQCDLNTSDMNAADQLALAEVNLASAQASWDELLAGPTSEELTVAEINLEQAQTQLERARQDLEDAVLVAPFDGVITAVNVLEGETVSASMAVMALADVSQLHIDISIDELDISQVVVGQPANITLEAFDDQVISGTVSRVAPAGESSQGLVTYTVRVSIDPGAVADASGSADTAAQTTTDSGAATTNTDAAASSETAASVPATNGFAPGAGAAAGQGGDVRQLMPVLQALGGPQVVAELLAQEDGVTQFVALLEAAELTDEQRALIEEMGGPEALADTLGNFAANFAGGFGGAGGFAASASGTTADSAASQPAAADAATTTTSPASSAASAPAAENALSQQAAALPIRLGMTAEVEVIVNQQTDVLVVPSGAIQSAGPQSYILVQVEGQEEPVQVNVTVGDTSDGLTAINGDVAEGQTVYVPVAQSSTTTNEGGFSFGGFGALTGGGGPGGGAIPAAPPGGGG